MLSKTQKLSKIELVIHWVIQPFFFQFYEIRIYCSGKVLSTAKQPSFNITFLE